MRYIRQTMPLKQNKQNKITNQNDRMKMDQLRLQIKQAYAAASMLKQSNKKLLWKIEMMEKQMENHQQIKEQLQFLREQENRYQQQLANHDQINRKLREQLYKVQKDKEELTERLKQITNDQQNKTTFVIQSNRSEQNVYTLPQTMRLQDYSSAKIPRDASSRTSVCMSTVNERPRENHQSTPKSKIQINLHQIMPQTNNNRKKVFFLNS